MVRKYVARELRGARSLGAGLAVLVVAAALMHPAETRSSTNPSRAALLKALAVYGKNARIGQILKRGEYTGSYAAPTGGYLEITWFTVRKGRPTVYNAPIRVAFARATISAAGPAVTHIRLTGDGRYLLRRSTRIRLHVRGSFVPDGEPGYEANRHIILKR